MSLTLQNSMWLVNIINPHLLWARILSTESGRGLMWPDSGGNEEACGAGGLTLATRQSWLDFTAELIPGPSNR